VPPSHSFILAEWDSRNYVKKSLWAHVHKDFSSVFDILQFVIEVSPIRNTVHISSTCMHTHILTK